MFYRTRGLVNKIEINGGTVEFISQDSPYFIRFNNSARIGIQEDEGTVKIKFNGGSDNKVTVNLQGMERCDIRQDSGTMFFYNLCPVTNVFLGEGTMKINTNATEGIFEARLGEGTLKNDSQLQVIDSSIREGSKLENLVSGKQGYMKLATRVDQERKELGDHDSVKTFEQKSGSLIFERNDHIPMYNINHDQEYVHELHSVGLSGEGANNCSIQ